jgi:hypothetical protein
MQPITEKYSYSLYPETPFFGPDHSREQNYTFGEMTKDDNLTSRCITTYKGYKGEILIGYLKNGNWTGNFIRILEDGEFRVGEIYEKDGKRR